MFHSRFRLSYYYYFYFFVCD